MNILNKAGALLCFLVFSNSQAGIEVIKSPHDDRQYQYLELDNQMRVLLISDPEADKAAAALSIGIGSTSNPEDRAGLAHFLEHMLFMGTQKYPQVDDYEQFIKKQGGSHNAFTSSNQTTYFFDVKADALEPALDRFAQFFIAPLFNAHYVERERNAVHSEYQLKIKDDERRINAAQKQSFNPKSAYARFTVGNLDTLADRPDAPVRQDLIQFYQRYYSANLMGLVVLGKEPLSQLKAWVEQKFAAVPNRQAQPYRPSAKEYLYTDQQLPVLVQVKPLKQLDRLNYSFVLPETRSHYQVQPLRYISHFIGDEGKGSLYDYLLKKGWITHLSAYYNALDDEQSLLDVELELTASGRKHLAEIHQAFFSYIALLKEKGIEAWRYQELKQKSAIQFRFQEKTSPSHYVTRLSANLLHYPPAEVISGSKLMQRYDQALIQKFIDQLSPNNVAITWVSPQAKTDQTEFYYQVPYAIDKPPAINAIQIEDLKLPEPNPFIPEKAALKAIKQPMNKPQKIDDQGIEFWYQQDDQFRLPKAFLALIIEMPQAYDTAEHAVLLSLWVDLIEDELNPFTYPAQVAGLSYSLSNTREGLKLVIYGYDEKQSLLLEQLVATMRQPQLKKEAFELYREQLKKDLLNKQQDKPYVQILEARRHALIQPSWSPEQKLAALEKINYQDLLNYARSLWQQSAEVRALYDGNITAAEALQIKQDLEQSLFKAMKLQKIPEPTLKLPDGVQEMVYEVDHPDTAMVFSYHDPSNQIEDYARWRLLAQIIAQPFYHQLRTEQQLGYAVFAGFSEVEDHPSLVFLVQSSVADAPTLKQRIQAFIQAYPQALKQMPAAEFEQHQQALIAQLTKKDNNLMERASRYLSDLERENEGFDFQQRLAAAVAKVDQTSLIQFYQQRLLQKPRLLIVYSQGKR